MWPFAVTGLVAENGNEYASVRADGSVNASVREHVCVSESRIERAKACGQRPGVRGVKTHRQRHTGQ